jgi:tetratricopeptide (TPR) repeat protein
MEQIDLSGVIPGRTLSHYTLLEELHRGEMQIVYRARDDRLNREVALKLLPTDLVQDPERRQRFVAEAKASASLEHPHIGVIHEIDEADGVVFIAMELLRGQSLAMRLAQGGLPAAEALEVGIGVASGLAYAHERGIVHRDVKPANVMFTEEGYPKLIDFGLAKLLDAEKSPFLTQAGADEAPLQSATSEGLIAGTISFMSPEQARGGRVDQRSDVFSFGLLLYTTLTGRLPFEGASRIDILHAILREPTPRLFGLTAEARELLQPIVDRCLEKDVERRYSGMAEVLEDLKRARHELSGAEHRFGPLARRLLWAALALALVLAALMLVRRPAPPEDGARRSLAVLPFENLSGDPELDWLRNGLPDMLVTDLSQSPEMEVLGLDRLHPILDEMNAIDGAPLNRDSIEELARRVSIGTVVTGSFAKAGESIRISARLEDALTGKILLAEKVEAEGDENLFRLVEEITGRIKSKLEVRPAEGELDRDLREVTSASVEAYREYAEGIRLHERFREEEAVAHFQRAIELDPGFAMANAKLGVVMSNLGMKEEADRYAERALEHIDRLSERERYYIEGWYHSRRPETLTRAVAAYRKAIEIYPDHGSARHNLGNILYATEHYDEAIEQLEELRSRGMLFPATHEQLAMAYKALDNLSNARQVLEDYSALYPDDWITVLSLAQLEIETGDVERGLSHLDRAAALGATASRTAPVRWEAEILREEWDAARATCESLAETDNPLEKLVSGRLLGTTFLYRGRLEPVLKGVDGFVAAARGSSADRAQPLLFKAKVLLEVGDYRGAKDTALTVSGEDDLVGAANQALLIASLAAQHLGSNEEAERLGREYKRKINPALGPAPQRLYQFLEGSRALARGELEKAISHLNEAESMLAPRGAESHHALIWYSLATAHRRAGNESEAEDWYERIVEATEERLLEPIRYVRSFYYLGELYEADGDDEEARESYQRFLDHWGDGEIDGDLVRLARAKLR